MVPFSGSARAIFRGAIFPLLTAQSFADCLIEARGKPLAARTAWLQKVARYHFKWIGMRARISGAPPQKGLIASNHLGYFDIVALSSILKCAFVSKKEVESWPVFGAYAKIGGTIFVDREKRSAVEEVAARMKQHLAEEIPLVLFPEGTSSGGDDVMPFKTPLFEPIIALNSPVTPAAIHYTLEDGDVSEEVCYWKDMTLLPHLLNVMTKREIGVHVAFGEPLEPGKDRKALAKKTHEEVSRLHQRLKESGLRRPERKAVESD